MPSKKFEFLEHTADIKFRTSGKNLNEVFENVVLAVAYYLTGGVKIGNKEQRKIFLEKDNLESLMYSFIDEIIYLLDSSAFLVSKAEIQISGNKLIGILYGDSAQKYEISQIKAATYAEMHIKENLKGWEAQVVLDV
ncbi:hypothetical protein COU54_03110 [Candidatus Pacearchaeota archaeon CG10_big_fil_rev_8_21_14_0_10_31_24]|nr:MAG: hypothetical protein COU54_03110 [Candidatus Pacearchaeota archaeon CG10_big_fil_rev_8_21_14_0_10_31_24]